MVAGAVPFQRNASRFSLIPDKGEIDLPCGFRPNACFCWAAPCPPAHRSPATVPSNSIIDSGAVDIIPLVRIHARRPRQAAQSLEGHVPRASSDPFQYVLAARAGRRSDRHDPAGASPTRGPIPQITAITCETQDKQRPPAATCPRNNHRRTTRPGSTRTRSPRRRPIGMRSSRRCASRTSCRRVEAGSQIRFKPHQLDKAFRSEGVAVADMNGDGKIDIVAGNVYYAGPNWKMQPMLGEAPEFPPKDYSDAFLCFDDDINRDGAIDLVVVGFPGQKTHWLENPGQGGALEEVSRRRDHRQRESGLSRRGRRWRAGTGVHAGRSLRAGASRGADPTQLWTITVIAGPSDPGAGHGLGVGDVNKDGRLDVLIPNGWWEQPAQSATVPWPFHAATFYGGAQLCVFDFDGDGDQDVLGSSAHAYGIAWTEQTPEGWKQHMIDERDSQTHAIHLADMNGDGLMDFVTGKRYWAHYGHDPG